MPTITTGASPSFIQASKSRKSIAITNTDPTNAVGMRFFNKNTTPIATSDYDIYIGPGIEKSFNMLEDGDNMLSSPIFLIALAGTPKVVWEDSDYS